MKFLTIDASKSINPGTGESWYRAECSVSVDDNEVPEEVFQKLKARLDGWLPNPIETVVRPVVEDKKLSNAEKKQKQIDDFAEAIRTCTTLKALEIFRKLVERENIPILAETFKNKLKNLKGEHN